MDEKGRFAVALAGVGGCLCLAAGIVFSGHGDAAAPQVGPPPSARVEALPRWPVPSWAEVAERQPARRAPISAQRDLVMATVELPVSPETAIETSPVRLAAEPEHQRMRALSTRRLAMPMLVATAPDAAGAQMLAPQERTRSHGAVTGALVTAGTHVGGSLKTVGRTLRRVF